MKLLNIPMTHEVIYVFKSKITTTDLYFFYLTFIHFAYYVIVFCSYKNLSPKPPVPHPIPLLLEPNLKGTTTDLHKSPFMSIHANKYVYVLKNYNNKYVFVLSCGCLSKIK